MVEKLWKVTISFFMSVCLSVCLCVSVCLAGCPSAQNGLAPTGCLFKKIWNFSSFWIFVRIYVWLKSDKNNRCATWIPTFICDRLLRMRNMSDRVVEKTKTHIICSKTFFQTSCLLWGKVEKYGRNIQATHDNITLCMHSACWINKAADTHSKYVILIAFPRQQWLHNTL